MLTNQTSYLQRTGPCEACSLCQLFSVIVVAALFLCSLFHPRLLRVTVKSERIDATDSLLDWYLFIYLLIFLFCIPFAFAFRLPHVLYGCFFMLPAAVAAVLCCSTEAEVSLAVITLCLLHSSTASTGLLVSLFWSRSISAFLSVCLSEHVSVLNAIVQYVPHPSPSPPPPPPLHRIHEPHPCSLAGD